LLLLVYLSFIFFEKIGLEAHDLFLMPIDIIFIIMVYRRHRKLYLRLKLKLPSSWRNEAEIAQLVFGCLTLVHSFVRLSLLRA
jgi:hypothetical protein